MGSISTRLKKPKSTFNSLSKSLLADDIEDKLYYINQKLDMLDDKVFVLAEKTRIQFNILEQTKPTSK